MARQSSGLRFEFCQQGGRRMLCPGNGHRLGYHKQCRTTWSTSNATTGCTPTAPAEWTRSGRLSKTSETSIRRGTSPTIQGTTAGACHATSHSTADPLPAGGTPWSPHLCTPCSSSPTYGPTSPCSPTSSSCPTGPRGTPSPTTPLCGPTGSKWWRRGRLGCSLTTS